MSTTNELLTQLKTKYGADLNGVVTHVDAIKGNLEGENKIIVERLKALIADHEQTKVDLASIESAEGLQALITEAQATADAATEVAEMLTGIVDPDGNLKIDELVKAAADIQAAGLALAGLSDRMGAVEGDVAALKSAGFITKTEAELAALATVAAIKSVFSDFVLVTSFVPKNHAFDAFGNFVHVPATGGTGGIG